MVLCAWLLSLSIMFSRFTHVVSRVSTSFLFLRSILRWHARPLAWNRKELLQQPLFCISLQTFKYCRSLKFMVSSRALQFTTFPFSSSPLCVFSLHLHPSLKPKVHCLCQHSPRSPGHCRLGCEHLWQQPFSPQGFLHHNLQLFLKLLFLLLIFKWETI